MSTSNGHAPIKGFVPKPRTRIVECTWLEAQDGAEPLMATVAMNLTFDAIDQLSAMIRDPETTYAELFAAVSPHVIAWNAVAYDNASGEYAAVPPPSEAGADALRVVDPLVTTWLALELSMGYRGGQERPKALMPSASTPEPSDGNITTPQMLTTKRNRANRKASTYPASSATT